MKLQVNTSGAWKNVVTFEAARREEVLKAEQDAKKKPKGKKVKS